MRICETCKKERSEGEFWGIHHRTCKYCLNERRRVNAKEPPRPKEKASNGICIDRHIYKALEGVICAYKRALSVANTPMYEINPIIRSAIAQINTIATIQYKKNNDV